MGGEVTNYDQARVFPVIPGLEILYFGKDCPEQEQGVSSNLKGAPETIIIQKCSESDFCIAYRVGKHLPAAFIRYGCDMAILINPERLCYADMQFYPDVWEYLQHMADTFQIDRQFCVIKNSPPIREIFDELQQIPLPPTMFRFYMLLKSVELFLQFSILNLYSTQVHFYPYKELPAKGDQDENSCIG